MSFFYLTTEKNHPVCACLWPDLCCWGQLSIAKAGSVLLRPDLPYWGHMFLSEAISAYLWPDLHLLRPDLNLLIPYLHCWDQNCIAEAIIEQLRLDLHCCGQIGIAEARYGLLRQGLVGWGQFFVANVGYRGHPWGKSAFSDAKSTFVEAKIALLRPDFHCWVHFFCLSQISISEARCTFLREDVHFWD